MVEDYENQQFDPLVSFVINCYNGEAFLNKCLNSILNQTYSNWELIFWDNASTDTSAEIFNSYNDNRFKYFKSFKNVTLGQARAWAVNECKGEFIAFLDVDDEWVPEKTDIQIIGMMKEEAVLSYGGIINIEEATRRKKINLPVYRSGYIFANNLFQFEINMPTAMILKRAILNKNLNFDSAIQASEEYCLFMQLIYNEKVFVVNKPLANYLIRKDSLTNKSISRWAYERIYTLEKIIERHPDAKVKYFKEFKEAYARADYYKARYLWFIEEKKQAIECMNKIKFVSLKYFSLFIISLIPFNMWTRIHNIKNRR